MDGFDIGNLLYSMSQFKDITNYKVKKLINNLSKLLKK
jgi:hypothetical protein